MNLDRFFKAQQGSYEIALNEIKQGQKQSHWMWFIFPQIKGLGYSYTAQYYAINDKQEAIDYLNHPILFARLIEISQALLDLDTNNATQILGYPDDLKLKSSMTLFWQISKNEIFKKVLDKFFKGFFDTKTIELLEKN